MHGLQLKPGGRYVDATLGAGGHSLGILEASAPDGQLLAMDVDPQALEIARRTLQPYSARVKIIQASYSSLADHLSSIGWDMVDGILIDLGVSSMQVDTPERGFSFQYPARLDMRFDPLNPLSAEELVNDLPEQELAEIIYRYGEEPAARRIAQSIVRNRPVLTTTQLAEIILKATAGQKRSKDARSGTKKSIHPATRTFQALRIAVNRELEALDSFLPQALAVLAPGGRLAAISFHSLEDRIVKLFFRRESQDCLCPPRQPVCTCGHLAQLREITRKPVQPQSEEIARNPRSRSARLRIAEKLSKPLSAKTGILVANQ
ncbi:MAG: 16S rRNA (cytosine(1402)-N(4))-methyltransferase RsmH [Anaerolineales bacterium]|jgi:16S rRNA (cytosine1402-N4)-methyltransferase|nr:16S rRNA (cytosine(1402)-N(4))-methyltransferase RsmH [Anaerolineales bacterium]